MARIFRATCKACIALDFFTGNNGLRIRLGLEKQANIGIRVQKTQGLLEAKQPFPQGTYDIDEGKIGLAIAQLKEAAQGLRKEIFRFKVAQG